MALLANLDVMDNDILCGRGKGLESFPGNKFFRWTIKEHAIVYGNPRTSRAERSRLVRMIADRLRAEGRRFIKRVERTWVMLDDRDSKMKIGHALRDAGMEWYRGKRTVRDECVPSSHNVEKGDFASIVSEDEGDNSDAEDHTCRMYAPQAILVRDDHDVWAPVRVDMSEKIVSRIQLRLLDSSRVTVDDKSENIHSASERITECHDDSSDGTVVDRIQGIDHSGDMCRGGELSSGCLDVTLSEVFMNFVKDEGDSADAEVSSIDPIEWTYGENEGGCVLGC
ncbi:hypothetical protein MHU86_11002 [Fragilaria crotonensis]|nr:hypothetical protein MHU86_11002 [Fragilaria crotonensis]